MFNHTYHITTEDSEIGQIFTLRFRMPKEVRPDTSAVHFAVQDMINRIIAARKEAQGDD
jgi:hypothetical protein